MGTGSIKGITAVILGQFCLYGADVKGTHYFKKPLNTNKDQKDNTFYLAFTS